MRYLNPFALLNVPSSGDEVALTTWLRQEKKRLLAEYELHDSPVVTLGGQALDRSSLLALFAQLEDPQRRQWHQEVLARPALADFLTTASLDLYYQGGVAALADMPADFQSFMAPYFADAFNQRLYHAYRQRDAEEIGVMSGPALPLPLTHHAACYRDTFRELHRQTQEVEALAQQIGAGTPPGGSLQEVCDEWFILTLNALPAYFQASRDRYAFALESLALELHNRHRRVKLSLFVLRQGLKLQLGTDAQARLQHLLDQLVELAPAEALLEHLTGSGKPRAKGWWIAAGLGTLLLLAWLLM